MDHRTKIIVCPKPHVWVTVHRRLQEAVNGNPTTPPPPMPLILSLWHFTNDVEKQDQWQKTLAWADRHGLGAFIKNLPDDLMYAVYKLSDDRVGPLGGPMKLDWTYYPSQRSKKQIEREH